MENGIGVQRPTPNLEVDQFQLLWRGGLVSSAQQVGAGRASPQCQLCPPVPGLALQGPGAVGWN